MNDLQIFKNEEFGEVRTVVISGTPWLILKDLCEALGIQNTTDVVSRLDSDEVTRFNLGGQAGIVNVVNESGLYSVVLRSDKPSAKRFRKWVTSEVLPSIRKTGSYQKPLSAIEQLQLTQQAILEVKADVDLVNEDLQAFKMDMPILGLECDKITYAVKTRGVKCLGGKQSNAYSDASLRGRVYADIYGQLKREFAVSTYKAIKRSQTALTIEIVNGYTLPMVLAEEITDLNCQLCI